MTKVDRNNWKETKSGNFPWGIFKSNTIFFLSKNVEVFKWHWKLKFSSFATKLNSSSVNGTGLHIFPWDIFKFDAYLCLQKNIKVFPWLSKSKLLSFLTKAISNTRNQIKTDIFPWNILKSDTISYFDLRALNYFNDFQSWNFLVLWLKWIQAMKI